MLLLKMKTQNKLNDWMNETEETTKYLLVHE